MSSLGPDVSILASIESGEADRRVLEFAARGMVPLPPGDLVRAVSTILAAGDAQLVSLAEVTFKGFPEIDLLEAVASGGVRPEQLDVIARRTKAAVVLEPLIRHRATPDDTLAWLAERIEPPMQDILVTNQTRLLAAPVIVERLFENPRLSTEIRRRADEFLEEFFLKRERELQAFVDAGEEEEAPEPAAPETASEPAAKAPAEPELSEDERKSLISRVADMTIVQKIKLAYTGTKEERMFLIRDTNRLVSAAVLKSPKTRESDAETIANMKSVSEDVLRGIAFRKQWMRRYSVLAAIVKNPRSPLDITLGLVMRLNARDQKTLASDRNVPEAVRASARREVARREV